MSYKIGLVFAGGGAKGAYQIGVWRALQEAGIAEKISVVSGTSVGALNAVLFAQRDLLRAERIWQSNLGKKILQPNITSFVACALKLLASKKDNVEKILSSISATADFLKNGFFSTQGLSELILENVSAQKLRRSPVTVYATSTKIHGGVMSAERFVLNKLSETELKKSLVSSCALPVVFGEQKISNEIFYDGGITDNVPLSPLVDEDCTHAFVICLKKANKVFVPHDSKIKVATLYPSKPLGLEGVSTIDFSPNTIARSMRMGYSDAKKFLQKIKREFSEVE